MCPVPTAAKIEEMKEPCSDGVEMVPRTELNKLMSGARETDTKLVLYAAFNGIREAQLRKRRSSLVD